MREMMFADDDLNIHAHFARTAENFDYAPRGSDAAARIARHLDVHDRAIKFGEPETLGSARKLAVFLLELLLQFGGQLSARRNNDFMGEARFVGQHDVAMRAVAEEANNRGMGALRDFFDAAFEASIGMAPHEARFHAIAMHRVAHAVRVNEQVAVHSFYRPVGDNEAVAVAMRHQSASDQIWILFHSARSFATTRFGRARSRSLRWLDTALAGR